MEGQVPRHRFMAAYEQKVEPPDRKWQYLLFAAEPYETIAFKVRLLCKTRKSFKLQMCIGVYVAAREAAHVFVLNFNEMRYTEKSWIIILYKGYITKNIILF